MRIACGFLSILAIFVATASADDAWPQFRGPTGQGQAGDANVPLIWSETENVRWKTTIPGRGWSSPVILGNQVWMTTALEEGKSLRAVCVDRETGAFVHNVEVLRPTQQIGVNNKNSYASPTPVLEEGSVYVHFGTLGTACVDTASGAVRWATDKFLLDHREGPGSSPILYRDLLIFHCDGMDTQYVVALHKATGEIAWKTNRSGPPADEPDQRKAFSTPLVIDVGGQDQLISPAAGQVISYDPSTGQELWKVLYRGFSTVPRPAYGAGLVFVSSGYTAPELLAIRPDGRGDVTDTHVAWRSSRQVPANPSPLVVDSQVYMVSDQGVATCLNAATGDEVWRKRLGGNFSASPLSAGGRVYFTNEDGETFVVQAGGEYQLLATNALPEPILASLAVAGNALFVRSETSLYRIEQN